MIYYDIECSQAGELLAIGRADDSNDEVQVFSDWDAFFDTVDNGECLVAHNGSAYDSLSIIEHLLQAGAITDFEAMVVGSKIIKMDIQISNSKKVTLIDSFNLIPSSLNDAAKMLLGESKLEIDCLPENLPREKLIAYLKKDCLLLKRVLNRFWREVSDFSGFKGNSLTTASLSLKIFEHVSGFRVRKVSSALNSIIQQSYNGGWVQVFRYGEFKQVSVYDVNSMYPYVMRTFRYPVNGNVVNCMRFHDSPGWYRVQFDCGDNPSPIVRKSVPIQSGIELVNENEFKRLDEIFAVRRFLGGFRFVDTDYIFREHIDNLYRIKTEKKPLSFVVKLLMNSLYGKFAQREETISIGYNCSGVPIGFRPLVRGCNFYEIVGKREVIHRHLGIGAAITANTRAYLHQFIDSNTVYCDTDSIHTTGKAPNLPIGDKLGQFKLEFSGSGIYVGKKLYLLFNELETRVKSKGIRSRGNPVYGGFHEFTLAEFRKMLKGGQVTTKFRTMPTIREVLAGAKACKPIDRQRKVRKT
jgi:hypothetical protein